MNILVVICLFGLSYPLAFGAVNLVLMPDEVRRLLGLNRELSYIRNGIVNLNAVNFALPVSSNNDSVHFMWYNEDPTLQVTYKMVISLDGGSDPETSDESEAIMHQPSVNISHSGQLPQTPTVWRVALPCSGTKFGTVAINIDITLIGALGASILDIDHSDKKNPSTTKLRLKRTKTCSEPSSGNLLQKPQGKEQSRSVLRSDLPSSTPPHMLFFAALLSAIIVILILIICVIIIHMRSRNKMPLSSKSNKPDVTNNGPSTTTTITTFQQQSMQPHTHRQATDHHIYEAMPQMIHQQYQSTLGARSGVLSMDSQHYGQSYELRQRYIQPQSFELGLMSDVAESRVTDWIHQQQILEEETVPSADPQEIFANLQVERSRLKLGSLLQEGTFSRVYQGSFESDEGKELDVMIKTVLTGSSPAQCQMLVIEGVRLQGIIPGNKNLLQLLAATWDGTSPMLIYSYSSQGNLKQYLTKYASGGMSTHQVVRMGIHLLSAIGHLHKRGIIHKDIAARNCFLAEGPTLKLADSALSRDLFPNDYHCLGDNENRPIKWMPLESIVQGVFSRSSDVWSFGVVLWELMTRAQQPYPEIDPFEMEAYLNEGYRLPQPMNCPDQLFSVLVSCWGTRPQERASLQQLHQSLQALQRQLQQFV